MKHLLMLITASTFLTIAATASYSQGSCTDGCLKFCQKRNAVGSMMAACQSKCVSDCEIKKTNKGSDKSKKK